MMTKDISQKLVVAISSRALFDLDESNAVYEQEGVDSYADYQIQHENEILKPGVAFTLVEKFLKLNQKEDLVEVILLSRNSADTGLRVFNSIQHYQLNITRAAFTGGKSPFKYIQAFGAHLFLSTHAQDVRKALEAGHAAATIFSSATTHISPKEELRIAFDGDAVLFSDEAEQLYQQAGLAAFTVSEQKAANHPLSGGPFKGFLAALQQLQSRFPSDQCPIRTALVTARQAPAHERVIKTLRAWNIRIDEALFLGGLEKGRFLQAFEADIFFDDQHRHCQSAAQHVATGHVPNGILNENI
ncbi:5'-nucleotidase [Coxiella burnetii]|uniref:5'-nucleotidase n=3 Tax=Coxiella burnetii TaxID=777 RepID=Q83C95_COXBU|nr:5'-nucleotidase [Coxiella burnetii]NP_820228.2 5'-nucleotidase [Coxiella burnetii RSA 493]AAO90742.2 5'-nucleotidase [Coxiella burnetii RSA 493]ARI66026.1 5'-nucleotidase [Coxiella burnetii]ARK27488.1 5'-nucleotidase [Coxiella burnetii]MCF2094419.1 5'-nucleotidase [Coxiella burnetii]MCF2095666.1 5'-nucleotidase [Coxiella burnetii]